MKYENSSNLFQAKISSAKVNYESDLITFANSNNPRVYKYIKSLTKSHTIPPTLHHDSLVVADSNTDKANMFNTYFYSVFTQAETNQSLPMDDILDLLYSD